MDRNQYLLSGIIILVVLVVAVIAFAFSGNNNFNSGTVSFEYPKAWSQNTMVGNFNSSSLYSEVTLTNNYPDANGQNQPAYIIIQMQQKVKGTLNLPSTNSIVMNTSNSSVSSTSVNNVSAAQIGNFGSNLASKYTIIDKNNFYYVLTYICPIHAVNQTEQSYNNILKTLQIS
jgi:hypothetical protein